MEDQRSEVFKIDIENWVKTYGDDLYSWAFHKTNSRQLAEDLVQETFLAAYKSYDSFKGQSNVKTWIFKILNNKIVDYYRKSARQHFNNPHDQKGLESIADIFDQNDNWKTNDLEDAWMDEKHLLDDPDFNQVMDFCMNDLPTSWRIAVLQKYHFEKDAQSICQELNISTSNYWQIIHRAKLLLKKCLEKKWFSA